MTSWNINLYCSELCRILIVLYCIEIWIIYSKCPTLNLILAGNMWPTHNSGQNQFYGNNKNNHRPRNTTNTPILWGTQNKSLHPCDLLSTSCSPEREWSRWDVGIKYANIILIMICIGPRENDWLHFKLNLNKNDIKSNFKNMMMTNLQISALPRTL